MPQTTTKSGSSVFLRCGDIYVQLAAGFVIGLAATVYRCIREVSDVLTAPAPTLEQYAVESCRCPVQQLLYALRCWVVLEAWNHMVAYELFAAWRTDPLGELERFESGRCCEFGLAQADVALGLIGEENTAGFVSAARKEGLAFADELVGTACVAEIEETLPGVDGQVGGGHPGHQVGTGSFDGAPSRCSAASRARKVGRRSPCAARARARRKRRAAAAR